mmetsp:Transcript_88116/g.273869  ORF Transcript_88116/g.273869 Transcript_88116/m.273869 type:complete len:363 (+) Transcript_88116:30-1118(+)
MAHDVKDVRKKPCDAHGCVKEGEEPFSKGPLYSSADVNSQLHQAVCAMPHLGDLLNAPSGPRLEATAEPALQHLGRELAPAILAEEVVDVRVQPTVRGRPALGALPADGPHLLCGQLLLGESLQELVHARGEHLPDRRLQPTVQDDVPVQRGEAHGPVLPEELLHVAQHLRHLRPRHPELAHLQRPRRLQDRAVQPLPPLLEVALAVAGHAEELAPVLGVGRGDEAPELLALLVLVRREDRLQGPVRVAQTILVHHEEQRLRLQRARAVALDERALLQHVRQGLHRGLRGLAVRDEDQRRGQERADDRDDGVAPRQRVVAALAVKHKQVAGAPRQHRHVYALRHRHVGVVRPEGALADNLRG